MTQEEIFQGIAEKDNRTFAYLYRNNKESITRMVRNNGGNDEDALDIFQEGIIALWTNIREEKFHLKNNTRISTYLYSVCRNLWISKLRKKKKVTVTGDHLTALPDRSSAEPFEEENPELTELRKYFRRLDEKCQKLLKLFYFEKKSMREISAEMNITEKTAKNNKYRCMIKMRDLYSQNQP